LLFAMASGWLSLWEARDPDRLRRQVDAERIIVVGTSATPGGAPTLPATVGSNSVPASPTMPDSALSQQTSASPDPASSGTRTDASTAANSPVKPPLDGDSASTTASLACLVDLKSAESNSSYIVYLAPSESAKEAQRKLAELKRLGVTEAFLMQDGPLKLGISLGLFRAEEGARALVQQLSAKGIRSAKISAGNAMRNAKVILKASGTEPQLARVRQAASEVSLSLRPCAT
jgi:hypothetical protein